MSKQPQQHDHDHTEPPSELPLRVRALESLLIEKGIVDRKEMHRRAEDWRRAYRCTPHGQPVELSASRRTIPRAD